MRAPLAVWLAVGGLGFLVLPWYGLEDGFWNFAWLGAWGGGEAAPGLLQGLVHGKPWLLPLAPALLLPLAALRRPRDDRFGATLLIACGAFGLVWMMLEGFAITHRGPAWAWVGALFQSRPRQFGMGYGALLTGGAFLFFLTLGLAGRGAV